MSQTKHGLGKVRVPQKKSNPTFNFLTLAKSNKSGNIAAGILFII